MKIYDHRWIGGYRYEFLNKSAINYLFFFHLQNAIMIIIYKKFKQFTDGIFNIIYNIDLTYSWVALWRCGNGM